MFELRRTTLFRTKEAPVIEAREIQTQLPLNEACMLMFVCEDSLSNATPDLVPRHRVGRLTKVLDGDESVRYVLKMTGFQNINHANIFEVPSFDFDAYTFEKAISTAHSVCELLSCARNVMKVYCSTEEQEVWQMISTYSDSSVRNTGLLCYAETKFESYFEAYTASPAGKIPHTYRNELGKSYYFAILCTYNTEIETYSTRMKYKELKV